MSVPIPRKPPRLRGPDAPPLTTRSGNKPHQIQGPPTKRRTREEIEAEEAAANAAKAAAKQREQTALARVAAEEDANRREDERRKKAVAEPTHHMDVDGDEVTPVGGGYDSGDDTDAYIEPNASQDENSDDNLDGDAADTEIRAPKPKKTARADVQSLRRTRDTSGTPSTDGQQKRKGSNASLDAAPKKKKKAANSAPAKKSGLAPKPAQRKPPAAAAEEDNSMFRFGGPALEDGNEHVERPGRKGVTGLPKMDVRDVSSRTSVSSRSPCQVVRVSTQKAMRGGVGNKWSLAHLPPHTADQLTTELVPLVKMLIATSDSDPWLNPPIPDMQLEVDRVYGTGKYVVTPKQVWAHLLQYRCNDYRRVFVEAAIQAFNHEIATYKEAAEERAEARAATAKRAKEREAAEARGEEDADADDETPATPPEDEFWQLDTPEHIAEYVQHLRTDSADGTTKACHWKNWHYEDPEQYSGLFCTFLIRYTFTAHLHLVDTIPSAYPRPSQPPYGSLLIAIQAVEYVLGRWATGTYIAPNKKMRADEFSAANWADYVDAPAPGSTRRRKVRRATKYLKTLQSWTADEWTEYIAAARTLQPKTRKRRGQNDDASRASSRASSTAPEDEPFEEDEEDEEFVIGRR
ncbi:hypothetical protein GGX14DRAFT_397226 [Mycena pura]|uniref:Uncharacterized protein n=1 Tax=Mycena pura TaxID=153505 RepID=A0AAD6VD72_9AGAR|nr:hypothetical protein GGX14DRAFT_397226 [Mycena pura]